MASYTRILGLDLETTGLDKNKDQIVEVAAVVWDVNLKRPIMLEQMLINDVATKERMKEEDAYKGHGHTITSLDKHGVSLSVCLKRLIAICESENIKAVVAHNGENFDKPFLLKKYLEMDMRPETIGVLPWIDTREDIEYPEEWGAGRKLSELCTEAGFLNPFPHIGIMDVMSMLKLLSHFDYETILQNSAIPWVTVQALVGYEDRELAKKERFSWEITGAKIFPKMWVKKIRQNKLEKAVEKFPFQIKVLE